MLDQDLGTALDELIQPLVPVQVPNDQVVRHEQGRSAKQPAGDAVVFADDRILNGVRQREQHHEVERVQLRELPLAGKTQGDDQERVHEDGPGDFFDDGQAEEKHVVQRGLHGHILAHGARPGAVARAGCVGPYALLRWDSC